MFQSCTSSLQINATQIDCSEDPKQVARLSSFCTRFKNTSDLADPPPSPLQVQSFFVIWLFYYLQFALFNLFEPFRRQRTAVVPDVAPATGDCEPALLDADSDPANSDPSDPSQQRTTDRASARETDTESGRPDVGHAASLLDSHTLEDTEVVDLRPTAHGVQSVDN
jgi:hypothetical protein